MTDLAVDNDWQTRVFVVIPTYNEHDSLPRVVAGIVALGIPGLQILIVDDNSPDGTGHVADRLAAEPANQLSVLHRPVKAGLGSAYIDGISRALDSSAQVIVQMDADLSHSPSSIPVMLRALHYRGSGVVIGSRYVYGGCIDAKWPRRRRWLSRNANRYLDLVLNLEVRDATSGFKAWQAEALHDIDFATIRASGYAFQFESTFRASRQGWELLEVPISFQDRTTGRSKMSGRDISESLFAPWRLRFGRPATTSGHLVRVH